MTYAVDLKSVVKHIVNGSLEENLCRICLQPLGNVCENIFTKICKADAEYCIADVLKEVCQTKCTENERYNVCSHCFATASAAYKFYLLCQRSNQILNFYVDELVKNVDLIELSQEITTESLCITLPDYEPDIQEFDYNLKACLTKKFEIAHSTIEESKVKKRKIQLDEKTKTKSNKNAKQINDNEDIVIVVKEEGKPSYYKLNSNSIWESTNILSPTKKVKRKRDPMTYKQCSRCPVKYRFMAKLKEHMKLDHNLDLFICKVCKETTEDEDEFNNHLQMHTNIHRCAICNTVFKKRDTIIAHLKWHEEMKNMSQLEGAHVCELCGIILPNEAELTDHYDKKHDKKYTCFYCGKMYRGELSFEMHIKKHEMHMKPEEKRHHAETRLPDDTKVPQQPSKARRRHECETCGRSFVDERSLKWHTMLHNNDRPFACNVCGRGFVSVNRRNQHAVCAHTAPARRCPLCPALFHLRSMVNSHIKKVHIKAHKRRNRTSKHQNVYWRTEPVPIQELSVAVQNEIIELKTAAVHPVREGGRWTAAVHPPVREGSRWTAAVHPPVQGEAGAPEYTHVYPRAIRSDQQS